MAAPKVVTIKPKQQMPNDCCGICVFAHHITKQDYLLCMANPPFPVADATDDGITWERGAAVDAGDPRCWFFIPKGRV